MVPEESSTCPSCGKAHRSGAAFCPHCGRAFSASPPPARTPEPARQRGGKPLWFIAVVAVICLAFGYLFIDHLPGGENPVIAEQPSVEGASAGGHVEMAPVSAAVEGENLSIPLDDLVKRRIVEFSYVDGALTIPLLAFITPEGKVVTAFRMCEPCNSTRYAIDGDRLSCGNCETQWSLGTLEGLQGSCQKYPPQPIPSVVSGGKVVMRLSAVRQWNIRL